MNSKRPLIKQYNVPENLKVDGRCFKIVKIRISGYFFNILFNTKISKVRANFCI